PIFDFSYNNDNLENTVTQRREINDTVNAGATYQPTTTFDLLPGKALTFRPIPTSITLLHTTKQSKVRFPGLEDLTKFGISTTPFTSTNITQLSNHNEARLAFRPWEGFTFNPTYGVTIDTERRNFRDDEIT